jgi:hypothetical protein
MSFDCEHLSLPGMQFPSNPAMATGDPNVTFPHRLAAVLQSLAIYTNKVFIDLF